jgi:protein transport protein SEC13
MATTKPVSFETGHEEMIHDAQLDYYGKRLATASSDRTVKVFEVSGEHHVPLATLKGHTGPVWAVAWGHPKFGTLLASCGYDAKVYIWREEAQNQWTPVFEDVSHESSVNAVAWGPHSFGLSLAAASADGNVSVHTYKPEQKNWDKKGFAAHKGGVNALSWGPDIKTGALLALNAVANAADQKSAAAVAGAVKVSRRFVTGGCDNRIKIWREMDGQWIEQRVFVNGDNAHSDWVRDVAWAPSLGLPTNTIASCSDDKTVIIWTEDASGQWRKTKVLTFKVRVWKVSWSLTGSILAVAQGDNKVTLWKEALDGDWKCLSDVSDKAEDPKAAADPKKDGKDEKLGL